MSRVCHAVGEIWGIPSGVSSATQVTALKTSDLLGMGAKYNPRKISDHDFASLRRSLREFGAVQAVIVNQRTKHIVGGHQRVKAASAEGIDSLPVVYVDLDETRERQLNIALNRIHGEWDDDILSALIAELSDGGAALDVTGFDDREIEQLLAKASVVGGLCDADEVPPMPEAALTYPGDLIIIGRHRLLCGDATSATDVERLLDGAKPSLMVTDPPYGVNYDPTWRDGKGGFSDAPVRQRGAVTGDASASWGEAYALFPGDVAYIWHGAVRAHVFMSDLLGAGYELRAQIVWVKQEAVMSRGAYHWQHEPCLYAVRKGKNANWSGDRKQSTVWMIQNLNCTGNRGEKRLGHGTQKPIECMRRPIANNSQPGDGVYDPFSGSGTTLIAAEESGRNCYGLEIEPAYCDIIVRRWQSFTGKTAEGWRGNP